MSVRPASLSFMPQSDDPEHNGRLRSVSAHDLTEVVICATFGCGEERHYTRGPGSGHCLRHGREKCVANVQHAAEGTKERRRLAEARRESTPTLTGSAQAVLRSARRYDAAVEGVRKAEERMAAEGAALKDSIAKLIYQAKRAGAL